MEKKKNGWVYPGVTLGIEITWRWPVVAHLLEISLRIFNYIFMNHQIRGVCEGMTPTTRSQE